MTDTTGKVSGKIPLTAMLHALAHDESRERIAVSDLLEALGVWAAVICRARAIGSGLARGGGFLGHARQ